ncbi:MAG: AlpA family phage regulatory protein [Gammaproteobacteria bacterium]|nr:AlpA family phage regulatory protein [Gammaproteobacteria bacterium]
MYNKTNPRSAYYDPEFPKPISLGARAKAWTESSLQEWIEKQVEKSRSGGEVA